MKFIQENPLALVQIKIFNQGLPT